MENFAPYSTRTKYRKINSRVREHLSAVVETVDRQQRENTFRQQVAEQELHGDVQIEHGHSSGNEENECADNHIMSSQVNNFEDFEQNNSSESDKGSVHDDISEECNRPNLRKNLAEWAVKFNVSHACLSSLLKILQRANLELPSDPRTLLSTPRESNIVSIAGGSYYHFGIENSIYAHLHQFPEIAAEVESLTLRINFDGLPLHKSSHDVSWPILGMLKEIPKVVFVIGLFCGKEKPSSVGDYLSFFVKELAELTEKGIDFQGKHFDIALPDAFICDAPARAFIKCVKGHSGYYGCERCIQTGVHVPVKMTFPEVDAPLRTDRSFLERTQKGHHTGESPLAALGISCVSSFVLDYMHLVCLGVTRKLIILWTQGPLRCRISARILKTISEELSSFRQHLPRGFSRKPRSICEFRMWKATEFRQFLLYTGPIVLRSNLPNNVYCNFMVLSIAIRILLSPALCSDYCDYAEELLKVFVQNFSKIYGADMVVYNIHNLLHLADDVRKYGALDSVSCFPFENYLGQLKKMVRRPQNPLPQIIRRLAEKSDLSKKEDLHVECHKQEHLSGPLPAQYSSCKQYRRFKDIGCTQADNCFGLRGKVVLIRNILLSREQETFVVCEDFEKEESIFHYPLDCANLGMRAVSKLSGELKVVPVAELTHKYVRLPFQQKFIVFPQLHDC